MRVWPADRDSCPRALIPYWDYRGEVGIQDGVLLKGNKIIIPALLQPDILQQLHASHQGIEKTKLRARTAVYWVEINQVIENITMKCPICQKYQLSLQAEALLQHDTLSYPWQYVSKSPFVKRLYSTTSTAVINQLKQLFEERGLPEIVYSDNGNVPEKSL